MDGVNKFDAKVRGIFPVGLTEDQVRSTSSDNLEMFYRGARTGKIVSGVIAVVAAYDLAGDVTTILLENEEIPPHHEASLSFTLTVIGTGIAIKLWHRQKNIKRELGIRRSIEP